jgi:hypothetical protein
VIVGGFARLADVVIANAINYLNGNPTGIVNLEALKAQRGA